VDEKRLVTISKYLAKHLRHQPERLGLTLAPGGWVAVDALLRACAFPLTRSELDEVVTRNDKRRYSYDPTRMLIRANQGHSTPVDLQLEPVEPPEVLYHGTGEQAVPSIMRDGLQRMARHHVHLSPDVATARKVGARHGRPAVLVVEAGRLHRDGHAFYVSANGVWLVDDVPAAYLSRL
jgi:putative RNA 2'-phosphotransferase